MSSFVQCGVLSKVLHLQQQQQKTRAHTSTHIHAHAAQIRTQTLACADTKMHTDKDACTHTDMHARARTHARTQRNRKIQKAEMHLYFNTHEHGRNPQLYAGKETSGETSTLEWNYVHAPIIS